MPTTYAHIRFGVTHWRKCLREFTRLSSGTVRFLTLACMGRIFCFYDKPFSSTRINAIGYKSHERTGADFFPQAVKAMKASSQKEAALSYLMGVLSTLRWSGVPPLCCGEGTDRCQPFGDRSIL